MARCQAQRGFLALRPCDEAAVASCATCSRAVCAGHLVDDRCTECGHGGSDWRTDPQGPRRYRRSFYQEDRWMDDNTLYWGYDRYGFSGSHGVDEATSEGAGFDS